MTHCFNVSLMITNMTSSGRSQNNLWKLLQANQYHQKQNESIPDLNHVTGLYFYNVPSKNFYGLIFIFFFLAFVFDARIRKGRRTTEGRKAVKIFHACVDDENSFVSFYSKCLIYSHSENVTQSGRPKHTTSSFFVLPFDVDQLLSFAWIEF